MTDYLSPQVHFRGQSSYDAPAELLPQCFAAAVDLALLGGVYFLTMGALQRLPVPSLSEAVALLVAGVVVRFSLQYFLGASPGQQLWKLRLRKTVGQSPEDLRETLRSQVYARQRLGNSDKLKGAVLSTCIVAGSAALGWNTLVNHPITMAAQEIRLPVFIPPSPSGPPVTSAQAAANPTSPGSAWTVLPFYYSNGAWPLHYAGQPVFFTAPYEKGPPSHFLGRIVARWEMPDTRLTVMGPITPARGYPRKIWESCMKETLGCLQLRKEALSKAVEEMKTLGLRHWQVRWFSVENPHIPEDERPQGIYLSAENETRAQDRMILINERGTQQSFVLDRPANSEQGRKARELFEQAMGSQRVSTELQTGRAWINRMLAEVKLTSSITKQSDAEFAAGIAKTQALLLSKISVEPKVLDAYYHLGGTALVLARRALKQKNTEWSSAAKILIQNSYRYAQDIAPADPRTRQLESYWVEVKNY